MSTQPEGDSQKLTMGDIMKAVEQRTAAIVTAASPPAGTGAGTPAEPAKSVDVAGEVKRAVERLRKQDSDAAKAAEQTALIESLRKKVEEKPPVERSWLTRLFWGRDE